MFKASRAVRFFFLIISVISTLIFWLSQSLQIVELIYIVPGFFIVAAITGICPSMIFAKKLFNET